MSVLYTSAIILRHTTDREHDRLLTILTPTTGQLRVRARGTKKSVSKLGGSLEPMMEVELNIADGRTVGLVTGSIIRDRFAALRTDAVGITMGQWLLELVEAVTKPEQPAVEVYDLTLQGLRELAAAAGQSVGRRWMGLCRRALLLMQHEGFAPTLETCSVCHRSIADTECAYDARLGIVHQAEAGDGALILSSTTVRYLRQGLTPGDDRETFAQTHTLIESLVHHTLDRPLKSERVLRSMVRQVKLPTAGSSR